MRTDLRPRLSARSRQRDVAARRQGRRDPCPARPLRHGVQLQRREETANVEFDRALLNELASLRFIEARLHVAMVGHVRVGKTGLAHAPGHVASRCGYSVLALSSDAMLKSLNHARLTQCHENETRALCAVDLLIIDDFGLAAMDAQQNRDAKGSARARTQGWTQGVEARQVVPITPLGSGPMIPKTRGPVLPETGMLLLRGMLSSRASMQDFPFPQGLVKQ